MKYKLNCTSCWGDELNNILNKYPNLKEYKIETDYPYPNKECVRIIIEVNDLMKFYEDIKEEIIISKENNGNDSLYSLEIYDDYRE